jgi:CPA2 family monovalent cation:H+ antiporter-2
MPANASFLLELGIIAGSALAFSLGAWRLHLPIALGQLIAGMVIGPFAMRLVTDLATIQDVAEVGIVLLLFVVGLELDPSQLRRLGVRVLYFTCTEFVSSFLAGVVAGVLLGWPLAQTLVLAGVMSVSSTALVAKFLYERRALSKTSAGLMMSALVIEDLIAVLLLSLMPTLTALQWPSMVYVGFWSLRAALLVGLVLIFGIYVAPRVIDRISQLDVDLDEAGFLLSLSLAFAMAVISSELGFSPGIGAFLMGLVIRGKRARFIHMKTRALYDLFLTIFFVSMGMLVDTSQFLNLAYVLPVVGLGLVGKYIGSYFGAVMSSQKAEAKNIAIDMLPRGEFSFILARDASAAGVAGALIYPLAGSLVLFTTLLSAVATIPRNMKRAKKTTE